jgi:hypothetical protein
MDMQDTRPVNGQTGGVPMKNTDNCKQGLAWCEIGPKEGHHIIFPGSYKSANWAEKHVLNT